LRHQPFLKHEGADLFGASREQIKAETGSAQGGIVVCTDAPAMRFDNGPTDGQTHTHAGVSGREKAVEKAREMLRIDAGAAVLDAAAYRIWGWEHGLDGNATVRWCTLRHCLDSVDGEV
jgi:hypothetical protein